MLRFFKRRRPVSIVDTGDNPLAIRDLSEHPALRELLVDHADEPEMSSPVWRRLAAAGPIRFDLTTATAADRATVAVSAAVGIADIADIAA